MRRPSVVIWSAGRLIPDSPAIEDDLGQMACGMRIWISRPRSAMCRACARTSKRSCSPPPLHRGAEESAPLALVWMICMAPAPSARAPPRVLRGLFTGVEAAVAHEPRDERRLDLGDATAGAARQDQLVGQPLQQMVRRGAPVGEAREIDRAGLAVDECRREAERAVVGAYAARPAMADVLAFEAQL